MQGLSIEDCKTQELNTENYISDGYVSYSELCQPKNVFDEYETYNQLESRNRWLDDYGWL